jgi:hypothetical protein
MRREGVSAVSLDWAALHSIAGMTDEIGVLSIFVTMDPHARLEATTTPPWALRMRHQLDELREQVRRERPREHWKGFTARLGQLELELQRLVEPAASGRGRALFAAVAGGEVRTVFLQAPLTDLVVLQPRASIRPLVAAWSAAGPAGVASVSADGLRIVDLRFGRADPVETVEYQSRAEAGVEQRQLKGPAAAGPMAQHSAPQQDLFARREDDRLLRWLRTVGPRLASEAAKREWGFLVLTGEASLVQAVRDGLPAGAPEVVILDHPVSSLPDAKLAATVAPALAEARHRHHRALAERVRDQALSANHGAFGLGETLGALQEGRVAHLLLDADRHWSGSRTPDGRLVPGREVPPGVDAGTLTPEPHLGERMIELAFEQSAAVTVLTPDAAAPLADVDGVGAILRW